MVLSMTTDIAKDMEYRRLGRTGLRVSVLSCGSWVTFDARVKDVLAVECMQAAYVAGCTFCGTAGVYGAAKVFLDARANA